MSDDVNCPYCNKRIEICHDDGFGYDEDELHEYQCRHCEKNFVFTTNIIIDHTAHKADCLNGADHKLYLSKSSEKRFSKMRCEDCSFSRYLTEDEMSKL